jgi:hypothetical protein
VQLSVLQVANNPLNFSKPCLLSTTCFPIESVFLQVNSNFSAAVFGAQKECIMASAQADCTARKANISSSALQDSMQYKASEAPAQPPSGDTAAVAKPAPGDAANGFVVAQFDQLGPSALLHLGDVAGGAHKGSASAADDGKSEAAHGQPPSKNETRLEGGPLVDESVTFGHVTAEHVAASKHKIVRGAAVKESAVQPVQWRASWANNLPLPFSVLASLAQARTLPSIPVPTASGPLTVPTLPRLSSNSTGSGCTTVATCRAAFVSLKKLRVIQPQLDMALPGLQAALPLESQSLNVGPAGWQLGVPRP